MSLRAMGLWYVGLSESLSVLIPCVQIGTCSPINPPLVYDCSGITEGITKCTDKSVHLCSFTVLIIMPTVVGGV